MIVAQQKRKFAVYGLKDLYHRPGEYEFKIVLNPKFFKNCHFSSVSLVDSDRKPMKYEVKKWGRKLICSFIIDTDCSDGVSTVELVTKDSNDSQTINRVTFWVVK